MTQDEKSILLKDLCARLPYGLQIKTGEDDESYTLLSAHPNKDIALIGIDMDGVYATSKVKIDTIKPYLRPMSSMTEEEKEEMKQISKDYIDEWENTKTSLERWKLDAKVSYKRAVFYNSHHLDWNGLIELGLSLEAPERMYKTE